MLQDARINKWVFLEQAQSYYNKLIHWDKKDNTVKKCLSNIRRETPARWSESHFLLWSPDNQKHHNGTPVLDGTSKKNYIWGKC